MIGLELLNHQSAHPSQIQTTTDQKRVGLGFSLSGVQRRFIQIRWSVSKPRGAPFKRRAVWSRDDCAREGHHDELLNALPFAKTNHRTHGYFFKIHHRRAQTSTTAKPMSYLKIYPKRIIASLNNESSFEGVLTLSIEQYGLLTNDKKCDVKIAQERGMWQIWVQPVSGVETPQYKQFVESLNHYLFTILKASPLSNDQEPLIFEVFFDSIYFDLSGQEVVMLPIPHE